MHYSQNIVIVNKLFRKILSFILWKKGFKDNKRFPANKISIMTSYEITKKRAGNLIIMIILSLSNINNNTFNLAYNFPISYALKTEEKIGYETNTDSSHLYLPTLCQKHQFSDVVKLRNFIDGWPRE